MLLYNTDRTTVPVPKYERMIFVTNKEKLIQYINSLSDKEAEEFISFLETIPSSEQGAQLLPQCNSQPDHTVSS